MNERIRELDKQAYQWAVNESKGGPNICAPGSDYFLAMEKKKFAESLIQECAKIVEDSTWNLPHGYKAVDQAKLIKKHFGVEE